LSWLADRFRNRRQWPPGPWVPAVLFLVVFASYLRDLHPGYRLDDSPETVAACANLGVQHMPGYPLHTLLGRVFAALPAGSVCFRVNLLAAAGGAGCVTATAAINEALVPGMAGWTGGAVAGMALGFSKLFWDTGLSAKGGLYTVTILLVLLAVLAVVRRPRSPAAWLAVAAGGAIHWMTVACWVPGLLWAGRPWTTRRALVAAIAAAVGLSAYLQLPLCAAREPVFGDPGTARGCLNILLRRELLPQAGEKTRDIAALQLLWGAMEPLREAQLPFVLVALAGFAALWRRERRVFWVLASGWALTLVAVSAAANPVHFRTGERVLWVTAPFLLPCTAALAVAFGAALARGLAPLDFQWRTIGWGFAFAIPVSLIQLWGVRNDHSADYLGFDYAENMRCAMPTNAILFAEMEYNAIPALALRHVEGRVSGLVVTNPFLSRPWGWKRLRHILPGVPVTEEGTPGERVSALASVLLRSRPVFHTLTCAYPEVKRRFRLRGVVQEVLPAGRAAGPVTPAGAARWFRGFRLRGLFGEAPFKDELVRGVLDGYIYAAIQPAERERLAGRLPGTIAGFRRALRLPGRFVRALVLRDLGLALAMTGDHAGAAEAFRAAAKLKPGDLDLWTNVGIALANEGRTGEARLILGAVLRRDPGHAQARAKLAEIR